jgi:tetratricopeptide (TPR) repeat protein
VGPNPAIDSQLAAASSAAGDHKAVVELLLPHAQDRQLSGAAWALLLGALHRAQRFDEARALVESCREAFSSDAVSLGAASLVSFDAGDLPVASELAQQALALNAAQIDALVVAGFAALNESDGPRAVTCLTHATALRPAEPRAWSGLGFAKLFVGDLPAAQAALEQSVALDPRHAGTWHGLAWSRIAAKDVPGAKAAFEGALECDRNFAETHGGLALVAHMQGDRAAAEQSLARALKLDRRSPTARYAQMLMRGTRIEGNAETAVRHILEAPGERNARVVGQALFGLARRDGRPLS